MASPNVPSADTLAVEGWCDARECGGNKMVMDGRYATTECGDMLMEG
jgi:hypothetical protein